MLKWWICLPVVLLVTLYLMYYATMTSNLKKPKASVAAQPTYAELTWKRRKTALERACRTFNGSNGYQSEMISSSNQWQKPPFFFSDGYKLLMCAIPKCGSTEWKKLILMLENIIEGYSVEDCKYPYIAWKIAADHRLIWQAFDINTDWGKYAINSRLKDYFKIVTVREPLGRLVSAYKDKFERETEFKPLSESIHKRYGDGSEGLATFSEFIDSILDADDPLNLNEHWRPFGDLCGPCSYQYDYILKMETIYDDIKYVSGKIGIESDRIFKDYDAEVLRRKWKTEYPKYYQQLTPEKRKAIFEYHRFQYEAFDYPHPDFLNK